MTNSNSHTDDSKERAYWTRGFQSNPKGYSLRQFLARLTGYIYLLSIKQLYRLLRYANHRSARNPDTNAPLTILAIGPFFSENWAMAHMEALCRSHKTRSVTLISPTPYKTVPGLNYVSYSPGVARLLGNGVARSICGWRSAIRLRPDLVIGYHLPWNGLTALLASARSGSRVAYFSVGGPPEIIGGGIYSEHALFSKIATEDSRMEEMFRDLIRHFDAIFTMGNRSAAFFAQIAGSRPVTAVAVGIDDAKFKVRKPEEIESAQYDLVSVGRLSRIKRTDYFLRVVAAIRAQGLNIKAAVVGDGDQNSELVELADKLKIADCVDFLGWVDDVDRILLDSKIFVMTSASEGLPHSLIESMLTGMPAIATDVGEISDLIIDNRNGFLVEGHNVQRFAALAASLLTDKARLRTFGQRARDEALRYSIDGRLKAWSDALGSIN